MKRVSAIVPAAGRGRRFGSKTSKLFFNVDRKPIFFYTLRNLSASYRFDEILIAAHPDDFARIKKIITALKLHHARLVTGGETRAESVRNALHEASDAAEWVVVHDAARPLVSRPIVERALAAAQKTGGAISAYPVTATVKRVAGEIIAGTEDRRTLYLAQTPQVFRKEKLLERYRKLGKKALSLTDEASFFDGTGTRVAVALGAVSNLKITTPEDVDLFRFYLKHGRG